MLSRFKFSNNPFPGKIFNYYSIPLLFKYYINESKSESQCLKFLKRKRVKEEYIKCLNSWLSYLNTPFNCLYCLVELIIHQISIFFFFSSLNSATYKFNLCINNCVCTYYVNCIEAFIFVFIKKKIK